MHAWAMRRLSFRTFPDHLPVLVQRIDLIGYLYYVLAKTVKLKKNRF